MTTVIIINQNVGCLRQLSEVIRESTSGATTLLCKDLVSARAAIQNRDARNQPADVVVMEEAVLAEVSSVYETFAFLRELNERRDALRPRTFVLTEQRHGDPRFAQRFTGCITHRLVNVLNGSTTLDLS